MIPVLRKPEPANFDEKVRKLGLKWMQEKGIDLNQPLPEGVSLESYWRNCLDDLYTSYDGVCAYVCRYIPKTTGARSVDHFIAKSSALSQAYEWSNYRLACSKMNTRKNKFDDVLDPFSVASDSFRIDFLTGEILINLPINTPEWDIADKTIKRLGLDDQDCRDERVEYFNDYISGEIGSARLKKEAPFVWLEMERQQLL